MTTTSSNQSPANTMAWIEEIFPLLTDKVQIDPSKASTDMQQIRAIKFKRCVQSIVMSKIESHIRQVIAPNFWKKFSVIEDERQGFEDFRNSVNDMYNALIGILPVLDRLEQVSNCEDSKCTCNKVGLLVQFKLIIQSTLLSQIPTSYNIIVEHFYKIAFNVFCNIEGMDDSNTGESSSKCEGCAHEATKCQCQTIVNVFHETNKKLIELGLLERLVGSILTSLIHVRIKGHVSQACDRTFDTTQLKPLEVWLKTIVINWLIRIYSGGSTKSVCLDLKIRNAISRFQQKLLHFLYETYARVRIEQLFNIVIEYPDSQAAIDDLRFCLERTDLRKCLIRTLQEALKVRLLHPGVNTPDILTAYIAAIKALRQLDPTGVLLEMITEPIKVYLRSRDDTVRCVVSGLLDESPSDLADELAKGESLQLEDGLIDDESVNWETWMPDPVDADPSKLAQRRMSDIISMLVNIYGSQDLFVNEYRTLLADRLLSQLNYQTEREIRHLELLKRRFGEHQLHYCEVMLKDVHDSKRIDSNIQLDENYNNEKAHFATRALILSAQFWPPFKEDWKLELPKQVQDQLDKYVKAFETLKGNRTLCWKSHLGNVNLDIELKDRKLNINVTPIHATIILHFQEKSEWNLDQLAEVMHVPTTILRRKIAFWLSHGLITELSHDTFALQEDSSLKNRSVAEIVDDEEAESVMASASDQREEELQVFWSYIVGMLTNLDSMPLDRIHQMLKMFASQGSGAVECGLPELRLFLDKKVREHHLLLSGGLYKLPKT